LAIAQTKPANSRAIAAGEQPTLATKSHAAERALSGIVRQTDPPVIEEARERRPASEHVVHRSRYVGVPRQPASFGSHPLPERCNERRNSDLADGRTLRRRQPVDRTLDIEDRVNSPHRLDRKWCFSDVGELEQLAPTMRPTCRFDDRTRLTPQGNRVNNGGDSGAA
jgi:hypothetical protein